MAQTARSGVPHAALQAERVKNFLRAHPETVRDDADLIALLGLRIDVANLIDFGPIALERAMANTRTEAAARQRLEAAAKANHSAQRAILGAALDMLDSRDLADLARCVDDIAIGRFALVAGVLAVESKTAMPEPWVTLAPGQVDLLLPSGETERLGHLPTAQGLFGRRFPKIASSALLRLMLWDDMRPAILAFGSADPEGFTPGMETQLLIFLGRIIERAVRPWPVS